MFHAISKAVVSSSELSILGAIAAKASDSSSSYLILFIIFKACSVSSILEVIAMKVLDRYSSVSTFLTKFKRCSDCLKLFILGAIAIKASD